jgi:hypothetical protein
MIEPHEPAGPHGQHAGPFCDKPYEPKYKVSRLRVWWSSFADFVLDLWPDMLILAGLALAFGSLIGIVVFAALHIP